MKKLIYMSTLVLAALTFNSCSSDDSSNGDQSLLVGKWEASTIYYKYPGGENTHAFSLIKGGCAVDVIELNNEKTGVVKVENNVEQDCIPSTSVATWNDETNKITVIGEDSDRTIDNVSSTELVLTYKMVYPKFGTTDVTVTYIRK